MDTTRLHALVDEAQERVAAARAAYDEATGPWVDIHAKDLHAAELHLEAVMGAVRLLRAEEEAGAA